jgi:hypothetical protein
VSDNLRNRMQGIDPMATGKPIEPVTSESSRHLLEDVMATEIKESVEQGPRRGPWYMAAAAALVLVVGGYAAFSGGGEPAGPPLELALPGGDTTMGSCIQFSVDILADMPLAFEGTAVGSADGKVTLDVDHWYKGGDAAQVVLTAGPAQPALIGGVDFVEGEQYLVTATGGNVNACGFSGPSTAELKTAFDQAFGA